MTKKSIARNKSFQPSGAGKGDGDRTSDVDSYRRNYDSIDWGRKHEDELSDAYKKDPRFPGITLGLSPKPLRWAGWPLTVNAARPFDSHTRGS